MASKYLYEKKVYNKYLGKNKIVKGKTSEELKYKVHEQLCIWKEQEKKQRLRDEKNTKAKEAEKNTEKACAEIMKYENILKDSLNQSYKINFDSYKSELRFKKFEYEKEELSLEEVYKELNVPHKRFLEYIFSSLTIERELAEEKAKKLWQERVKEIDNEYQKALDKYNTEKICFEKEQNTINNDIINWEKDYKCNKRYAVERYVTEVLEKSVYPQAIIKRFEIEYNENEKRLIILYKIPNSKVIPNIVEYKYVKTRDEITIKKMKEEKFHKFYDDVIYQITLRTINEIFDATDGTCIDSIVFNGWVDFVDKATGHDATSCIISILTNRNEFADINLSRIAYKECIEKLKGVFAGKLILQIPITPILNISREDKRFVESKEVLAKINNGTNLASMPWEDFEHLVGQLFEKKFAKDAGEVKITQASRDGGVDAVMFDPDPFKGGKFIIQAKRYNNVVPVTATRDLYGTVMHEKAIRGILVTTSSYGSDSYEFAEGKPLTLINGAELLGMFNELGYKNLKIALGKGRK